MASARTFQIVAVVYGLAGMAWGLQMGISGNHTMMPAHAHLNLFGWVGLSIMAAFYRSEAGRKAPARLRGLNFLLAAAAPPVFAAALARELSGGGGAEPIIALGSVLEILGVATFGAAVIAARD